MENSFTNNTISKSEEKIKKCKYSRVNNESINIDSKLPDFYYYRLNENRSRGFKFPCSNIYLDTEESFHVPVKSWHQIINPYDDPCHII